MPSPEAPRDPSCPAADFVAIALIQTTHGRRGEVAADLLTDFPERFQPGLQVTLLAGEQRRMLSVEAAWFHKGRVILKFEGVDSLTAAETLRGTLVQVPRSARFPLPSGRIYVSDLMGCSVLEQEEVLGRVVGWEETGAVPLLRVEGATGELLIPFTAEICYAVDAAGKQIRVRLPQGLREINPATAPGRKASHKNRR